MNEMFCGLLGFGLGFVVAWLIVILSILALPVIIIILLLLYNAIIEGFLYLFNRKKYYKRLDEDIQELIRVLMYGHY